MITEAIAQLVERKDLSYEMAEECMDEIMSGEASQMDMAAYLTALRMKGESIDEIVASANGMRKHATRLHHEADVLEALGVNITIEPSQMEQVLKEENISFMFAQIYHKAMRFVAPVRKELGIRTIFNILGPLSNPAFANMQLMGVYEEELVRPMAEVLMKLGVKRGMVVYGTDRLDEISISAPTLVCEIKDGSLESYEITPEQFALSTAKKEEMTGGDPQENAKITRAILDGEKGAKRDAVALNAGACIYIAGKAATLAEGIRMAQETIDSGRAAKKLRAFIKATNAFS